MTGDWEAKLARIERGEGQLETFMKEIEDYVIEVIGKFSSAPAPAPVSVPVSVLASVSVPGSAPVSAPASVSVPGSVSASVPASVSVSVSVPRRHSSDLRVLLRDSFGFDSFRPYQEDVCVAAAAGQDVLLVMPTGAGKSLCYQLPGLARGGTTLVVSPLIALMEDQVAALVRRGLRAERIHSGRDRAESRAVCKAYLEGALDFLFIAPERLKVPGFPEMLARRKPTLIAIDEAHCISQWGHDFRPDYRMLGERLPLLRPAPVIALTATATPTVQDDIASELRLSGARRFIHGFRRTNIGVEVVERNPKERGPLIQQMLGDSGRRPAIVYAPTRKVAEELAKALGKRFHAAAYHAGLRAEVRDDVQTGFLRGKIDVIVATTAFGMGIDKPDVRTVIHAALPATVEGYYQEIGRAGRDGDPSRAVLLHAFIDQKTHEFFLERDYPEPAVLKRLQSALSDNPVSIEDLPRKAKISKDDFDKALEKLWVHGGALVVGDEVRRGNADWLAPYQRQIAHKREQLARMRRYAETPSCRMLQLVRHFGDQNDAGAPCGHCDVCAPDSCVALTFRAPTVAEQSAAERVIEALRQRDGRAVGQLHKELFGDGPFDRDALANILDSLARAGHVALVDDEFEKDGETITFQRVRLVSREALRAAELRVAITPEPLPRVRGGKGKRPRKPKRPRGSSAGVSRKTQAEVSDPLERALRAWRAAEAKKRRVPAFRIFNDRTLQGIVEARPKEESDLLEVAGVGPGLLGKYGRALLELVTAARSSVD